MGFTFTVMSADIDEKAIRRDTAEDLVMALAEAKAEAIMTKIRVLNDKENDHNGEPVLLITADQVVVYEGTIREKPVDEKEARGFIKDYSKAPASTVGSVLIINLTTGKRKGGIDKTEIYFHPIPDELISSLIEEGEVFYCAGGLMVEHPLVSPFVSAMVGSIDSVMGLPKDLTLSLIQDVLKE
ncbi:hypothetical protein KP509_32G076000 [Ceratopteris richardii]|nr:hypothetical protein KP509_32G076000 [Ceratopteris richardii]